MKTDNEFIICAAIQIESTGKIYYGHRHDQCNNSANGELSWTMNRQEISKVKTIQGFVTNNNRFVDRKEGAKIWLSESETNKLSYSSNELYSEDLY